VIAVLVTLKPDRTLNVEKNDSREICAKNVCSKMEQQQNGQ